MKTKNYSDYISRVSGLIGIPADGFTDAEEAMLLSFFQTNLDDGWQRTNWIDLCPYGEARFVGNKLTYPNDLTQTSVWTANGVTVTANALVNPADGRITASRVLESPVNGVHSISQAANFIPSTNYQLFGFDRYLGRNFLKVAAFDGTTTFSLFVNLQTGAITSPVGLTTSASSRQADGYFFWSMAFTTSATAGVGSVTTQTSTDGVTLSFAGDATRGFYSWGNVLLQTGTPGTEAMLVAWEQPGEEQIEAVFEVWINSPRNAAPPWRQPYEITPDGLQMLSPGNGWIGGYFSPPVTATTTFANLPPNPVYLYYRKRAPDFVGPDFDPLLTYGVGAQVFFINSTGTQNFYRCLVATTAGQSPETVPSAWTPLAIPDFLFRFIVFGAYADWLRQDGQFDKAQVADRNAEEQIDAEFDRLERQMNWVAPMRVQTHVTARSGSYYN